MTGGETSLEYGFNVRRFGARGDGTSDDTVAIQKAIEAAAEVSGNVWFSPGNYLSARLTLRSNVALTAVPTWAYRHAGGTVIRLCDETAPALLDLSGTTGVRVIGLSLDGARLGQGVCGVLTNDAKPKEEECVHIESSRIAGFTGDGVRLTMAWVFTIRNSMIAFNAGDGVTFTGWDGFIYDNWFSGNGGFGFAGRPPNASITMVGNRIEWNAKGGVYVEKGSHYNINANFIDRSGGPGIWIQGHAADNPWDGIHAITGNLIYRSGAKSDPNSHADCHVRIEYAPGLVFSGNTLHFGMDDGGTGRKSPAYGILYRGLRNAVIKDNVMQDGALEQLMVDLGENDETLILKDNVGCLAPKAE